MVLVYLVSPKGNSSRSFPSTGYLGLTPLTVQGSVVVRLDAGGKPVHAHSLQLFVRCYEAHHGRTGQIHANVVAEHSVVLWIPPPHADTAPLADLDAPFRITIPRDSPGFSTAYYQEYRVFWRIEAVIAHPYILGIGARQVKSADLNILRYGQPVTHPSLPAPAPRFLPHQTSKPRAPVVRYHVAVPPHSIGPDDLLSVSITLSAPDPSVSIRSASLTVERRIQIRDLPTPSSPDHLLPTPIPTPPASPRAPSTSPPYPAANSTYTLDSNASSARSRTPLVPHDHDPEASPAKVLTHIVAGTESGSDRFARDEATGVWSRTLTLQWPAPRSTTRWALGETMATDMARIDFFVKVKLVVTSALGTDSLELREEPITVSATNNAERQLALSKYNASLARPPSSPAALAPAAPPRSKARRPPQLEAWGPGAAKPSKDPERPRPRPHTSAGRPHKSAGPASAWRPGSAASSFPGPPPPPPPPPPTALRHNTITGETSISAMPVPPGEHVRAWEEELARIEARSRMSSVNVGSGAGRRRVGVGGA